MVVAMNCGMAARVEFFMGGWRCMSGGECAGGACGVRCSRSDRPKRPFFLMTPALDLVWFVTGANVELGFRRGAVVDAVVVIYSSRTDEIYGCVAQAEKENEGHRRGKERKQASKRTNKRHSDSR